MTTLPLPRRVLAALIVLAACSRTARAQQTNVSISMQAAPAAPRIGGAQAVGVRPGTPFLHTIAATGTRPLTFSATGLPGGVSLDTATGRLSGMIAAAGTSMVT